ncbi:protein-disulfide reductase DsbD [Chlorobium phaeovibrioides]|nr:protein-disulfide reductase DsbD [Chlorobium phaeovibrioides]
MEKLEKAYFTCMKTFTSTGAGFRRILLPLLALLGLLVGAVSLRAADFLDPDSAFRLRASLETDGSVSLHWEIAEGYKLYRDQIRIVAEGGSAEIGVPELPEGIATVDSETGGPSVIYHDRLDVSVPFSAAPGPFRLSVTHQGCSEEGLCYPPSTTKFTVDPAKPGSLAAVHQTGFFGINPEPTLPAEPAVASFQGEEGSLATATLMEGSLWKIALAFFVFGLLIAFTPCVLPMLPILSSIIAGEGESTRMRSFLLSLVYSGGMALVYTLLGIAAGLAGEGLAGFLQQPAVLAGFAALLVVLSLSMFDVYQLQVPSSMQNRLSAASGKLKGGRILGVFLMGAISALVIGPCVAAPLAGTLVYISQTKNVVIGGLALFSMAAGISVPLLLIGLSAGWLLPRAGAWMQGVKYVFGILLIAVAIWMVTPVLPAQVLLFLWGALAILSAVFLGVMSRLPEKPTTGSRFRHALGIVMLAIGLLEIAGSLSGARNPLQPLSEIRPVSSSERKEIATLQFSPVRSSAELDSLLNSTTGPVMLDFYADWCVSCKELEHVTFGDPAVMKQLGSMTLLQADVTANSEDDRLLMKRFSVFGPPAIVFFDQAGTEIPGSRVVGFVPPEDFLRNPAFR